MKKEENPGRALPAKHDELRNRAAAFLMRPIPAELMPRYVRGSLADVVIATCARGEAPDAELLELGELAAGEYDGAIAQAHTAELRDYYNDCRTLLRDIVAAYVSSR